MSAKRKMTLDDLWSVKYIQDVALSPDGSRIAYAVQSLDQAKNEMQYSIWLLRLDQDGRPLGAAKRLTNSGKSNAGPTWAPDSRRLLFLSDREDGKQLWVIDTDGGEARRLTSMLHGVSEAAWSPDGQWITFTALVGQQDDDEVLMGRKLLNSDERKAYEENERIRLRRINKVFYRLDGRGLFDHLGQVFVMPAPKDDDTGQVDPKSIRRLTSDDFEYMRPSWTPDSKQICVLCDRAEDRDRSFVEDLWCIDRETGEATCLSDGTLEIESYSWSPDGTSAVVVAGKDLRIAGSSNFHLYRLSRNGGEIEDMTPGIDNHAAIAASSGVGLPTAYDPQWSKDGERVYFLITEQACVHPYRLNLATKDVEQLADGEFLFHHIALLPNERGLLLSVTQPLSLWELYLLPLSEKGVSAEMEQLTHLHDDFLAEIAWSKPERIVFKGVNNDDIEGWIMPPVGAKEGVRYPLVVRIHGGPQSAYGEGLNPYQQLLAAQGFAVFYCNPHGSTGHGQAFMREVEGDWGGWDYQDIIRGVDECIARGIADPERLVVSGYSYGGYMSMYIIGQTNRFKAAVPMAGVSNLQSFVGTSDIGFWQVQQAKGYPWEPERQTYYRERSPLTHAQKVVTPTLFLHPENDLRCPIEQSEQFYMTLKMMGHVPVEFIRVPGAWHGGRMKPSQYMEYWEVMIDWFRRYVDIRNEEYE